MDADRFGEKLMRLRRARGWTLAVLATRLGYKSRSFLSEVESKQKGPSVGLVIRAARLFGVTTDELLLDDLDVKSLNTDHSETNAKPGDRAHLQEPELPGK